MTSFDVVYRIRRITGERKAGHTGTLDPAATGVLPVCLGRATKVCGMLTDADKAYRARLLLGIRTDSQDMTGTVLERTEVNVGAEQVREAVSSFIGSYDQLTPMYSARRIEGRHLYDLARAGIEIERSSRRVEIINIEIEDISIPSVTINVTCSKGTYIRTLCSDIGDMLGCGAAMETLERLRTGPFRAEDSKTLGEIEKIVSEGHIDRILMSTDCLFEEYPKVTVSSDIEKYLENGNALRPASLGLDGRGLPELVRLYMPDGTFAAIYRYNDKKDFYVPEKMFVPV